MRILLFQNNIWDVTVNGVDFYHILSWFFIFSFLGWVWETCLVSIRSHAFVNRGFVAGPVCTIYGVGAVAVYLILKPLEGNYLILFLGGIIVATILEYVTSAVMETLFHAKWWDYSQHKFNLKGRICLGVSIGWGFMSLAMYLILMPFANWIMSLYPVIVGQIAICAFSVLYTVDFAIASVAAFNLEQKLLELEDVLEELGERLKSSKAFEALEDVLEDQKNALSKSQIARHIEQGKEEWIKKQDMASKRFMKSYPMLSKTISKKKKELEAKKDELKNKIGKE